MAEVPSVGRLRLGSQGLEVSALGLACMGMSHFYGPPMPDQEMISLIHHAVSRGVTFLDTANAYGPFINEVLVGKAIKGIREKVQLATKFGITFVDGKPEIRGDPAYVRACCEVSLKRLDVACIDLYYQHRIDTKVPIEVTRVEEISRRREDKKTSDFLRELGIGIVPYSPLGMGFLACGAKSAENLTNGDARKLFPKFTEENLKKNTVIFEKIGEIASRKGFSRVNFRLHGFAIREMTFHQFLEPPK